MADSSKNFIHPEIADRLRDHEKRLRTVEQDLSAIPRIEEKIDRIIDAGLGTSTAVHKQKIKVVERDLGRLEARMNGVDEGISDLRAFKDRHKYILGILGLIITAAAISILTGVEISSVL